MDKQPSPQEKAKEIYFAMLNAGKGLTSDYLAKECAKIAVNEIINSQPDNCNECGGGNKGYWIKVKTELIELQ